MENFEVESMFYLESFQVLDLLDISGNSEFEEFCHNLDLLDKMYATDPFTEAMVDKNINFKNSIHKTLKNTRDTTRDAVQIYGKVTDANGALIKNTWDLTMSATKIITNVITWLVKKLANIPLLIKNIVERTARIPRNVYDKIKGNIQLYITAEDIEQLYGSSLMVRIDTFAMQLQRLINGVCFQNFFFKKFKKVIENDKPSADFTEADVTVCHELIKLHGQISSLQFKKTSIVMNDSSIRIYFGKTTAVKVRRQKVDPSGKQTGFEMVDCTYYDALQYLVEDLTAARDRIKKFQEAAGNKLGDAYYRETFLKLKKGAQDIISDTIKMVSKTISIVGNIVRYIIIDMNTINGAINTVMKSSNVQLNNNIKGKEGMQKVPKKQKTD